MLIPFPQLVEKHKLAVRGIVHIGANSGQELEAYLSKGVQSIVFIEPLKPAFEKLLRHVAKNPAFRPGIRCINELVTDTTGRRVTFHITDNDGESSSILPMKEHLNAHPDVKVVNSVPMEGWAYQDLADLHFIDPDLNFLNIDVQGAELMVLQGMGDKLKNFDYAYIEVNEKELYTGCAMLPDIDQFMTQAGFERKDMQMTSFGWGDALYVRKNIVPKTDQKQPNPLNQMRNAPAPAESSSLSAAINEADQLVNSIRTRLTNDVSGSVADSIGTQMRTGIMNILNKYIKN